MKIILFILAILLFINSANQSQASEYPLEGQAKIDSLLVELTNEEGDTNEVRTLYLLSHSFFKIDPDRGLEFGLNGLDLSKKIGWKLGEAKCYNTIGLNYLFGKGKFDKALQLFLQSIEISEEIKDTIGIASSLGNIGSVYRNQSNFSKALEYYHKAIDLNEKIGYNRGKAIVLGNIGLTYYNQKKYNKALENYLKAIELNKELGNKSGKASNYGNIGSIYLRQLDYAKALEYYQMALELNKEIGYYANVALNLGNIGIIYSMESNYNKGLEYFLNSLEIHRDLGNRYGIANILGNIGELYLIIAKDPNSINRQNESQYVSLDNEVNLNKAIHFLLETKKLQVEMNATIELSGAYYNLHEAYYLKGMYKQSIDAHRKYLLLKDSIFSQKNLNKIAALEKAREDDLKQKEIEKQKIVIAEQEKREQIILYFSIGIVVLMAIVMFVIYRLLKRSDKLLYNVLPVSIAKRLKKKEHPISDYFTQASIVFIDIVNFTEHSKDEDPRRVVEALNKIFTKYDAIANKYGLEKIKTIGDSYMAAAGIPEVQKDNTHRAAQMALEVNAMMQDYHTADGTKIEVRIGLDCGPVVAGVIGENKFIYDMWSDAVNTASRMESSSIAGEVHVSERFKEAVTEFEEFDYVERGEIEIKGKGKMKTYFIGERKV